MSHPRLFILRDDAVRKHCAHYIMTAAPEGYAARITEPTRNLEQNAKFHAICEDLGKSSLEWAGKRRNAAAWKVLLVSGHAVVTKEEAEIIPGLEGEFINIRESTALMSVRRSASLIEYTVAFCKDHNVKFKE
jgi:hypothetical protein